MIGPVRDVKSLCTPPVAPLRHTVLGRRQDLSAPEQMAFSLVACSVSKRPAARIGEREGRSMDIRSTDHDIISEAQSGDLGAFEVLYTKHSQRVYRTALAILGNPQTAEEVLQDCFLRAYKHLHTLNGDPSVSPWLHRVAVNLCYSHLRRNYRSRLTISLESLGNYLFLGSAPSPEEDAYRDEVETAIETGLAALSFKHRTVIVLHYLQGFSVQDIAYVLSCPIGTVKSRLHHARKILSRRLGSLDRRLTYEAA